MSANQFMLCFVISLSSIFGTLKLKGVFENQGIFDVLLLALMFVLAFCVGFIIQHRIQKRRRPWIRFGYNFVFLTPIIMCFLAIALNGSVLDPRAETDTSLHKFGVVMITATSGLLHGCIVAYGNARIIKKRKYRKIRLAYGRGRRYAGI